MWPEVEQEGFVFAIAVEGASQGSFPWQGSYPWHLVLGSCARMALGSAGSHLAAT